MPASLNFAHILRYADVPPEHRAPTDFLKTVAVDSGGWYRVPVGKPVHEWVSEAIARDPTLEATLGHLLDTPPMDESWKCTATERWDVDRWSVWAPTEPKPAWTTVQKVRLYSRCPRPAMFGATLCRRHGGQLERRLLHLLGGTEPAP